MTDERDAPHGKPDMAPLDQLAEMTFQSEETLIEMKTGWEHPCDIHAWLKNLQAQAQRNIPQYFPDPNNPPLAAEIAQAADTWLTHRGANVIDIEAVRALKENDDA